MKCFILLQVNYKIYLKLLDKHMYNERFFSFVL